MDTYDFYGRLEPMEFQRFARDMIQARERIHLESFAETGDGGIDGRCCGEKDGSVIVFQAKRIRGSLLSAARSEKEKLDRLARVDRYIIVFSADASPGTKDRIQEELSPYVVRNEDIVFAADLNNYISSQPEVYRRIVENYPKLWIQNADELKRKLFETVNGPLLSRSENSWEEAVKKASIFVETDIYARALSRLQTNRALIISGSPGVGKTTLAEQLGLGFCKKYGFSHYLFVTSIDQLYVSRGLPGEKVLIFDDFWGSCQLDGFTNLAGTRDLLSFIESIQRKKDAVLIMTTREYILEQGLERNEEFRRFVERNRIDFRMEEYHKADKLRIYYGHLKNFSLTWEQLEHLADDGDQVIESPNYNPRVLSEFIQSITPDMSPQQCSDELFEYLECPEAFWRKIYRDLSDEARRVFLILALLPHPVELEVLRECYFALLPGDERKLEWKEFGAVIMELEKTVIRTDDYSEVYKGLRTVSYQNPSVRDFILKYISENPEQCSGVLYDSCLYFDQCIEYLKLLNELDCSPELYAQALSRAAELSETRSLDFFWTYREAEVKGRDSCYHRAVGSVDNVGRSLQLIAAYREKSCSFLRSFMAERLKAVRRIMKRRAEELSAADLELFPAAAAAAVREKLCEEDEGRLLEEFAGCLMRLRLRLDYELLEEYWPDQWKAYKAQHAEKIAEYLRKYYYAEMCLAAVKRDEEDFDYALFNFEEDLLYFGIERNEEDERRIERYDSWMPEREQKEVAEEEQEEGQDRISVTVSQVKEEFQKGYMEELCPEAVEEPEEWVLEAEISEKARASVLSLIEDGNAFWDLFLQDADALAFLAEMAETEQFSEDSLSAARQIFSYVRRLCGLTEEEMYQVFLGLDLETHRERIWSGKELSCQLPDFWERQKEKVRSLAEHHIFAERWGFYRLTSEGFLRCVFLEKLCSLSREGCREFFRALFGLEAGRTQTEDAETEPGAAGMRSLAEYWMWYDYPAKEFMLAVFLKLDPEGFRQELLRPLAVRLWERVCRYTKKESVRALLEKLALELSIEPDGDAYLSMVTLDSCLVVKDALDGRDPTDFSAHFSKEQLRKLEKEGFLTEECREIELIKLEEETLEELGVYRFLEELWHDICAAAGREENG